MNAEPPIARFQMEHQPRRPGYARRYLAEMYAVPPVANLLVIRSPDIDHAVAFYRQMGIPFERHSHGAGPEHYASNVCGSVFEIYPQRNDTDTTANTRFGFNVDDVDVVIELLRGIDATVISLPTDTEWGRRAVVRDFDGHTVELLARTNRGVGMAVNQNEAYCSGSAKAAK